MPNLIKESWTVSNTHHALRVSKDEKIGGKNPAIVALLNYYLIEINPLTFILFLFSFFRPNMSVTVKSELEVDTKSKIMEPCRSDITKLELEDDEIEDTKQKGPSINDVAIFSFVFSIPLHAPPTSSPLFY